jgi:hypothetical protein
MEKRNHGVCSVSLSARATSKEPVIDYMTLLIRKKWLGVLGLIIKRRDEGGRL